MAANGIIEQLKNTPGENQSLGKSDMDLQDATAGERSLVASYKTSVPLRVRPNASARISFVTAEEFTTNATADDAETFELTHDLVETKNTKDLVLYKEGSRVSPDSIDYAADSFDFTDAGTENTLHAMYVARDPGSVTIEKVAPKTSSQVSRVLTEDTTSGLADRDQNKEPVEFEFTEALQGVVPANWQINVYVDAPAAVRWDDSGLTTSNGDEATNAVLDIPIHQYEGNVRGLTEAVKRDALGLQG